MSRLPLVVRRLLMLLLGVCVTECGSQLFVALGVGADPFMILVQGISRQSGLSYGQLSTLIMLICLAAIFLCAREHIHIGTIFCMFCLGPIVDFYAFLFGRILPVQRPLALIVLLIILGCLIVSIGGAVSRCARMPARVQTTSSRSSCTKKYMACSCAGHVCCATDCASSSALHWAAHWASARSSP